MAMRKGSKLSDSARQTDLCFVANHDAQYTLKDTEIPYPVFQTVIGISFGIL